MSWIRFTIFKSVVSCNIFKKIMNTYFLNAKFVGSFPSNKDLPEDKGLEIAFCGRSNCGKSSVLNALTNNRKLAKTSKTPGRT